MNIFGYFRACKFSKDFIHLFPFSEDSVSTIFELKIDIMGFSETWRKIFKSPLCNFDNLLTSLIDIDLNLFHLLRKL